MMDQAVSQLLSAAIGASAAIGGGLGLEAFKRRRDRQGVALALAAAIETELWALDRRGHVAMMQDRLRDLEAGRSVRFFGFAKEEQAASPVFSALTEKVGSLPGDLPARVVRYFQTMWGIRATAARLVAGGMPDDPQMLAGIIRGELDVLTDAVGEGQRLAEDLRASAAGFFRRRPMARAPFPTARAAVGHPGTDPQYELEAYKHALASRLEDRKSDAAIRQTMINAGAAYAGAALRGLLLVNGGAIVALLTFVGNLWARSDAPAARVAGQMAGAANWFAWGLAAALAAAFAAYVSQTMLVEGFGRQWGWWGGGGVRLLACLAALVSLVAFATGAARAVAAFAS